MPNRIIKESINESKRLNELSLFAQDLFKRLITYADDYGRFNADTEIMRARLYIRELDSVAAEEVLDGLIELAGAEKVKFYTNKAKKNEIFGYFPHWNDHQRVRNTRAKCPDPESEEVNDWYLRRFVPVELKVKVFERDNFTCQKCGRSFKLDGLPTKKVIRLLNGALHIDHVVPVSFGGRATEENLRLLCACCNLKRPRVISVDEIIKLTESGENLPQIAAESSKLPPESNPIRIQSESESNNNPTPQIVVVEVVDNIAKTLETEFGRPVSPTEVETLESFVESGIEAAVVVAAIKEAKLQGKPTVKYIDGILRNCLAANVKTLVAFEIATQQFRKRNSNQNQRGQPQKTTQPSDKYAKIYQL